MAQDQVDRVAGPTPLIAKESEIIKAQAEMQMTEYNHKCVRNI